MNLSLGENGLLNKAKYAKEEYKKAQVKEELELEILNLQAEKIDKLELKDISESFRNKGIIINTDDEDAIEGEYKKL